MIVWLASYPRSGNRLIRSILYKSLGMGSYTEYLKESLIESKSHADFQLIYDGEFESFYAEASRSERTFLVKTHALPRDMQPAIYIVRDGRKSCLSYQYFHQANTPKPFPELFDIIVGNDFFGSWSEHYHAWQARGNVMNLRYEDIVDISIDKLREIALFVNHKGEVRSWENDFNSQKRHAPNLVREGAVAWTGEDDAWSQLNDLVFNYVHGKLMVQLGYIDELTRLRKIDEIPVGWSLLIDKSINYLSSMKESQKICESRLSVIDGLKKACDERLEVINAFRK